MGLDTTIVLKIRNKNTNEYTNFTICYFRKCYSIARALEELWTNNSDCHSAIETDNTYTIPIKFFNIVDIYTILSQEYTNVLNNYDEDYNIDTMWRVGAYMNLLNRNMHNIALFAMFIKNKVGIEELQQSIINIYFYYGLENIKDVNDWDWKNAELELCNSD